jgi:hypothetical protein
LNGSAASVPTRIVTFGNCQAEAMKRLLDRTLPAGYRVEFFSNNSRTGAMRPEEDVLGAIGEADVVVFQPLRANHGRLAADGVRAAATGELVSFPYLFNAGVSGINRTQGGIFGEAEIKAELEAGTSVPAVIQAYREGRIRFETRERFERSITELEKRDASTDLKVSGFIRANHTRTRLFLTANHPSTELLLELCAQLASVTGLPLDLDRVRALDNDDVAGLGRGMAPVSPHDIETMGYEFPPDDAWEQIGIRLITTVAENEGVPLASQPRIWKGSFGGTSRWALAGMRRRLSRQ